ncbi:PD-(D/E)XK nuclease-like domain-containing protein [Rubripirellula sp.]|nr:PD-(D/E)XK nuclease-like domain-containing protein [Rubripirellula sp.]
MSSPLTQVVDSLIQEPAAEYHAQSGRNLSSHLLARFRESPLLYHRTVAGEVDEIDRAAYLLGQAAHALILEGRAAYERQFAVGGPVNPKTGQTYGANTKAFQVWADSQGKPVLTDAQASLVEQLSHAVLLHPIAERLLDDGVAEGVLRADYSGMPCQIRLDWFSPQNGIVDLKTCNDLTWFESDARRFGYMHQMAFYRAVVSQFAQMLVPVHIIAVEKKEPYRCGVWQVGQDVLGQCQKENQEAIERLKRCQANDHWPTGYEQIRQFDYV